VLFPFVPTLLGALAVVVFDALGSYASVRFGFAYTKLSPGSSIIYGIVGFSAGRTGALHTGAIAAAIVAAIEATVGWAISWYLGPGRLPVAQATPHRILSTVVTVSAIGAICGSAGAFVAGLF
jgi:hypothetical protein